MRGVKIRAVIECAKCSTKAEVLVESFNLQHGLMGESIDVDVPDGWSQTFGGYPLCSHCKDDDE